MVPETSVEADHNWPQRMTMTTTNVEILRQGWLDAASALAPSLETLPDSLENGLDAAVMDERLDEQSLLHVVTEVTSTAADSLPADELYFLSRRLQRAVYEYLLSLDALPEPPPRREGANGQAAADATLIGAEEIAALDRDLTVAAETELELGAEEPPQAAAGLGIEPGDHQLPEAEVELATGADHSPDAATEPEPARAPAVDNIEAGLAELDAQLSPDYSEADEYVAGQPDTVAGVPAPDEADPPPAAAPDEPAAEAPAATEAASEPSTRPTFTLFRRTGAKASRPAAEPNGHAASELAETEVAEPELAANGHTPALPEAPDSDASGQPLTGIDTEDDEPFVAPRDGFHLSDLADFAVVQRAPKAPPAPPDVTDADPPPATPETQAEALPAPAGQEAPARGWRLRDGEVNQGQDPDLERSAGDDRFETDPEVIEARLEINDRLRRKRCDEAAALLQRLANDVGGRALAELALDAGDRCRSLGKGNAALSCYLAASRADPVHETPLLRLADICLDDHDIDLAVSYLERVTRLRRLRNDDQGALKLYRKIVTIAPYRDDILAMLMRAQASGRFDE
jgi:tetratricopeptide (TPR) repeat protein